jgi:hypothetical protein
MRSLLLIGMILVLFFQVNGLNAMDIDQEVELTEEEFALLQLKLFKIMCIDVLREAYKEAKKDLQEAKKADKSNDSKKQKKTVREIINSTLIDTSEIVNELLDTVAEVTKVRPKTSTVSFEFNDLIQKHLMIGSGICFAAIAIFVSGVVYGKTLVTIG